MKLVLGYVLRSNPAVRMRAHGFPADPNDPEKEADRQTASLAGIVIALVLVVVGLFLVHRLSLKASLEDCLMAGRQNCDSQISAH